MTDSHDPHNTKPPSQHDTVMLYAVALAFLIGALLTGYLGWTLMSS